jgi:hypothetical protein
MRLWIESVSRRPFTWEGQDFVVDTERPRRE